MPKITYLLRFTFIIILACALSFSLKGLCEDEQSSLDGLSVNDGIFSYSELIALVSLFHSRLFSDNNSLMAASKSIILYLEMQEKSPPTIIC